MAPRQPLATISGNAKVEILTNSLFKPKPAKSSTSTWTAINSPREEINIYEEPSRSSPLSINTWTAINSPRESISIHERSQSPANAILSNDLPKLTQTITKPWLPLNRLQAAKNAQIPVLKEPPSRRTSAVVPNDLPTPSHKPSNKRKATPEARHETPPTNSREGRLEFNCDEVRSKIRSIIESKKYNTAEFLNKIGISRVPYIKFMAQEGADEGMNSKFFNRALAYFQYVEEHEDDEDFTNPDNLKKLKKTLPNRPSPTNRKHLAKKNKIDEDKNVEVSTMESEGETDEEVEIHEAHDEVPLANSRTTILNCNEVRSKIKALIDSGSISVKDFQEKLGVTATPFRGFMLKTGADDGSKSTIYKNALAFFNHFEEYESTVGFTVPRETTERGTQSKKVKVVEDEDDKVWDVSMIELDGEEDEEVEVYDTCDVVRDKIRHFLEKTGASQPRLCRAISKTYREGKTVSANTLYTFQSRSGPAAGNTNRAFYAAYVFFEKIRIRDGVDKTEFREKMEDIYDGLNNGMSFGGNGKRGMGLKKLRHTHRDLIPADSDLELHEDEYGRRRLG